ncbi:MAG: hypothetical protein QOJ99_922 [Bryobacterales bacterium]|nr:hypothetical protein [Bryobacterales bacterium]
MAPVLRAIFGYCFLILIVRIAGRRPGKQMTPFELVLIFFIGGCTLTAMVGDDRSLTNAVIQIVSIALTHLVIIWAKGRSAVFGRIVDGTPLVLMDHGKWHTETMNRMRIQGNDVIAMARDQGFAALDRIEYAILERNGEISIIPKSQE